jgi:KDO2-lipid IV(A) lauroyltransferase
MFTKTNSPGTIGSWLRSCFQQKSGPSCDLSVAVSSDRAFVLGQDLYLLCVIGFIKEAGRCIWLKLNWLFACVAGFFAFHISSERRRQRERNLSRTLRLSEAETRRIVRKSFFDFWCDTFSLSPRVTQAMSKEATITGLENLKEALQKGRGVILWESVFFGRRVLAKAILKNNGFSVSQVHGEYHLGGLEHSKSRLGTRLIQPFFESCERPFVEEIIYLRGGNSLALTRVLLERLNQGAIISITADGKGGEKFIAVEFRGEEGLFSTGMISLARLAGATILPVFCVQTSRHRTNLIIESPIRISVNGDREHDSKSALTQYVKLLESYLKRYPEQYRN